MGWDWEWRWCHHSRSWEQHWIWVAGQFGDDYLAASTGVVADTGGSEDPGWQQQEQHWQGWWAAEDGPDGRQEDTQAWQGWSGWRSHGREHTTGQPGQPWHDEAWRRDRASQGSTQERGPVGDTGGADSARAFPSQGKGTPSVHRQDRSLEKAYRKNAEARAKRDPEAKRVSRSSFLRNRQRAPKSRRLGKGQGKASRADPPNQSLVRPPGVRSPPPARQKADARAKQEHGSAAISSHQGNGPAAEDRLEEAEAKETESSSSSSSSSPVGGPVPESRQQGTQAQAEMPSTSGQGPGAAPPSTEDLSPWSRRLMRKTTAVKTLPRPPSTTSSSGTEPPPRQKASAAAEDRPKPEAKVVPNTMEAKSSPVHRDEAGAAEEEATTESPQDVTMVQGPSEVLTAAVHQEPQATAAAAEEEKDPNDPLSPTSPADGVEGDKEAQDAAAPPLEVEALAPAAAANPPTEARSAAQAYPDKGSREQLLLQPARPSTNWPLLPPGPATRATRPPRSLPGQASCWRWSAEAGSRLNGSVWGASLQSRLRPSCPIAGTGLACKSWIRSVSGLTAAPSICAWQSGIRCGPVRQSSSPQAPSALELLQVRATGTRNQLGALKLHKERVPPSSGPHRSL